jgi:hypothetical protein
MQVFIPLDDEDLERTAVMGRLVPYQAGLALWSQYRPESDAVDATVSRCEARVRRRVERPVQQPCPR